METRALPDPFEAELTRLLDGPDADFWPGVARLCQQHPGQADQIRRAADAILAAGESGATVADAAEVKPGHRIGPFVVLDEIGHGGMGSVYVAEQKEPVRRRVALKVIKLGMDTRAVLARFEAERQALALMDHPHIAKVFEAGATSAGRPYFAMEYVKGIPITRYCDENRLSLDERLRLFRQVCSGVQHAHQKGVIHRDLTPNNVLVMLQDARPSVKIIDFGLARATDHKLTEKTIFTEQGVILGTPEYMSPEQAGLDALDVDMRSDVYTLGVVLYELLTGKLPFEPTQLRAAGYDAMCKTIREQDPPRPSTKVTTVQGGTAAAAKLRRTDAGTLLRRLRGDLDWIVLKCLEKDRTRRYESVSQLADDVQRHLDTEPVLARAPTLGYRLAKFARRYRLQLSALALVFLAVLAGLAGTTTFWLESRAQATFAAQQAAEAKRQEGIAQRQAEAAEAARAGEAQKAKEASASAAEAVDRKREFDLLAGVVMHGRAAEIEKKLYPAWPSQIEAMELWLRDEAGRLSAMTSQIDQTVRDLRARALPVTSDEMEQDRISHPKFVAWQTQAAKLASLARAHAIRAGTEILTLPVPSAEDQALTPLELRDVVWPRVEYDETERIWGEETRALALAKLACDKARELPPAQRAKFDDTLAWAWFANGKDAEAIAQGEAALALSSDEERPGYVHHLDLLRTNVQAAAGDGATQALTALRTSVAEIGAEVSTRRTFRFTHESQRFLHETLSELLSKIRAFDSGERRAVEARLEWARQIETLTLAHPKAPATWQQAREAIARADGVVASTLYKEQPLDLQPQMGLVPIGMNPVTKLWEFYELRSAWDPAQVPDPATLEIPRHESDGSIKLGDGTGIVFVLMPGATPTLGSQADDANGPNYDPQCDDDEVLHEVMLAPFFLARHELTQGQWKRLTNGDTPSLYAAGSPSPGGGPMITWSNPVESVDWVTYDTWLARHGLALPTEAQWEYGCRAWTKTPWSCDGDKLGEFANVADATAKRARVPWPCEAWSDGHIVHAPVGSYRPNAFGLFDVIGNAWEWTRDGRSGAGARPRPGDGFRGDPSRSRNRVSRGGSFFEVARDARSAARSRFDIAVRHGTLGIRPARDVRR